MSEELKETHEHHEAHKHHVKIYIDRLEHPSANPTTGAALYILGSVNPATHDLWKEEQGKKDDQFVENDEKHIHLKEWEHFYSAQKSLNPGNGDVN